MDVPEIFHKAGILVSSFLLTFFGDLVDGEEKLSFLFAKLPGEGTVMQSAMFFKHCTVPKEMRKK